MTNSEMIIISTAAFRLMIPMIKAASKSVAMANPKAAAKPQCVKMDTIITNKGMLTRVPKITKTTRLHVTCRWQMLVMAAMRGHTINMANAAEVTAYAQKSCDMMVSVRFSLPGWG